MKKILIIDDEPDSLQIMRDVLEEYTCRVYTAKNCKEGIRLLNETRPDLVFLDLQLPDGRGETLLGEIKRSKPGQRVVIGTAYGDQKKKDELMAAGADGFFDKPINLVAFERRVRELIGNLSEIRLLVIDDEPEFCQLFKEILEGDTETKWQVTVANTGEDGLKKLQEVMPDLISLDICLNLIGDTRPLSNGLAVYKSIRERGFQIPVIVLASYIDSAEAEELNREGMAAVFSKTELMGMTNMTHFLNVLKRIALRGSISAPRG
jgi:CheY-like chemotaxis protein